MLASQVRLSIFRCSSGMRVASAPPASSLPERVWVSAASVSQSAWGVPAFHLRLRLRRLGLLHLRLRLWLGRRFGHRNRLGLRLRRQRRNFLRLGRRCRFRLCSGRRRRWRWRYLRLRRLDLYRLRLRLCLGRRGLLGKRHHLDRNGRSDLQRLVPARQADDDQRQHNDVENCRKRTPRRIRFWLSASFIRPSLQFLRAAIRRSGRPC